MKRHYNEEITIKNEGSCCIYRVKMPAHISIENLNNLAARIRRLAKRNPSPVEIRISFYENQTYMVGFQKI